MKIRKIPVMSDIERKIRYKLPISGRTIEIPESERNRAIALACISTLEAGAGMAFTLGGIATKEPMFTGIGLAVFGKIAGTIAMVKGHLWDFAGNFAKKNELVNNILKNINKAKNSELNIHNIEHSLPDSVN